MSFTIEAHAGAIHEFVRHKTWQIRGAIDAEGLATDRALEGTLAFKLVDERRLPYRFTFLGDDGRRYALSGQKEWNGLAPIESMTRLPASVCDEHGEEIGRATLRFDVQRDLKPWIKSFRLRFGKQGL